MSYLAQMADQPRPSHGLQLTICRTTSNHACLQMLGPERRARQVLDLSSAEPAPTPSRRLDQSDLRNVGPRLLAADGAAEVKDAAKQALAENLEGMIEGMLRTTHFATSVTAKTRSWAQQIGEAAALDASTDDTAFTANSLIADLAQARPATATVEPRAPRRRWIDALLILASLLSVLSAGYLTFVS